MTERTLITEADFSVKALNSIKRTFPNAVTLGELRQAISDDPKSVDYLGRNTYKEIESVLGGISGNDTAVVSSSTKCGLMTETAKHAYTVHAQIILGAQMVEDGLYQMAKGFKIMRDEKLYKELGYKSFEEYCETETGIKRRQVYSYIAIAEKLPADFVHSGAQIGVKKLALLTALDEEQRTEIVESTDLESTTVKELKRQIDELTGKNKILAEDVENLTMENELLENDNQELTGENTDLEQERDKLLSELKEAREQPKETVTIEADPTESRQYKALNKMNDSLKEEIENLKEQLRSSSTVTVPAGLDHDHLREFFEDLYGRADESFRDCCHFIKDDYPAETKEYVRKRVNELYDRFKTYIELNFKEEEPWL